jgi:selenocysteine lyase/cysteine desulfurase
MMQNDFQEDFGPFHGKIWLNCAHQGPLPRVAAQAALEAIAWKVRPFELTTERFTEVPARLRRALARLLGTAAEEIVLANSASYGLHLLANGFPWREGDEVLLVPTDFPSDILPWLALEDRGVRVRYVKCSGAIPGPEELHASLTPKTRVFCTTWVHSFSGAVCDLDALGHLCRSNGTRFVVNASQGLGARPLSVDAVPIDAVAGVGFKWLCGPYGTGFIWMRPDLLRSIKFNQAYWLTQMTADDLGKEATEFARVPRPPEARDFDVFGTANFFNFLPWAASLEYLLQVGIAEIEAHDQSLVQYLLDGLDRAKFIIRSPQERRCRSTLVFITHKDRARNPLLAQHLKETGIAVAFRRGELRFSPHLYNTREELDRALTALNGS